MLLCCDPLSTRMLTPLAGLIRVSRGSTWSSRHVGQCGPT